MGRGPVLGNCAVAVISRSSAEKNAISIANSAIFPRSRMSGCPAHFAASALLANSSAKENESKLGASGKEGSALASSLFSAFASGLILAVPGVSVGGGIFLRVYAPVFKEMHLIYPIHDPRYRLKDHREIIIRS